MPNFWSFITNGKYSIGCSGQTVYIYDSNGVELAKFRDITYAYNSAVSPCGDIFVVKSTEGRLAVYSLTNLCLIKKFRFSKIDGSQDDNFCFSPDGKWFYNIERHIQSYKTALSIYRTDDFSLEKRLFENDDIGLNTIEYDYVTKAYYLLGYLRIGKKIPYFVAKLCNDSLTDIQYITEKDFTFYHGFKSLEASGFTDKAKNASVLKYEGYNLSDIENEKHSLAKLWQHYKSV